MRLSRRLSRSLSRFLSTGPQRRTSRADSSRVARTADVALEPRVLLAGGGTLTVTDSGGDVTIDADDGDYDRVVVTGGTQIDSLTVINRTGNLVVTIEDRARLGDLTIEGGTDRDKLELQGFVSGTVTFNGDGGDDFVGVESSSLIAQLFWNGGDGDDDLLINGDVAVSVTLDGGEGDDEVRVDGTGDEPAAFNGMSGSLGAGDDVLAIAGDNLIDRSGFFVFMGEGNDRFTFQQSGPVDPLWDRLHYIDGEGGDDTFIYRGTYVDDVRLLGGDGEDRFVLSDFAGDTARIQAGADDDRVVIERAELWIDQVELGTSTGRDVIRYGADVVSDTSSVTFEGTAKVFETAARDLGRFSVTPARARSFDDSQLFLRMVAGTTVERDVFVSIGTDTDARSILSMDGITVGQSVVIGLQNGHDFVNLRNATIGSLDLYTGFGDDYVRLNNTQVTNVRSRNFFPDEAVSVKLDNGSDFVDNRGFDFEGGAVFVGGFDYRRFIDIDRLFDRASLDARDDAEVINFEED